MTKKKSTTTEKATTAPDQTPGQRYEQEINTTIDDWVEEALEELEAKIKPLDLPDDGRRFKPQTSDRLRAALRDQGALIAKTWHVPPSRPAPAELPPRIPSEEDLRRAAQRKRIEESHRSEVSLRRLINEDRYRAGKPLLPEAD